MSNQPVYVPVLRWKRAERIALEWLDIADKVLMAPLLELTPTDFKLGADGKALLTKAATQVAKNWGGYRAFVDFNLLGVVLNPSELSQAVGMFFDIARAHRLQLVPVTRIGDSLQFQATIASVASRDGLGASLRITGEQLQAATLTSNLESLFEILGLQYETIDLVVDLGIAGAANPSLVFLSNRIPVIERWRTFAVIAGAFPKDLTEFRVGQHLFPRLEWTQWVDELRSGPPELRRVPTFGDYTIQHAVYYEPPEGANVSASIRYTSEKHWLIMRGEGLRTPGSTGHMQYRANAQLLCERKEFCGPHFSRADEYIWGVANGDTRNTGNPETWLRAGINHHLTFVARQLNAVVGI